MASGITYAGKAIESINIENETKYLKNLISSGGGNATWAAKQLDVLKNASSSFNNLRAKTTVNTTTGQTVMPINLPKQTVEQAAAAAGNVSVPIDTTGTAGYDPMDYTAASSSGSSLSGSSIFGYVVVGLVMIVVLDRLMK